MSALPVRLAHELDVCPEERRWLIEGLWAAEAVGIVGGEPKCCLCRARHKQHFGSPPTMPTASAAHSPSMSQRLSSGHTSSSWARRTGSALICASPSASSLGL